jgi:hypothetical protein
LSPNNDGIEHFRPAVSYCNGTIYYLSSLAISKLANNNSIYFWEDITVAKNLMDLGIKATNYDFCTIKYNLFIQNMKAVFNDFKREYEPEFKPPTVELPPAKFLSKKLKTPLNAPKPLKKELFMSTPTTYSKEIPAKVLGGKQRSVPKQNTGELLQISNPRTKEVPSKALGAKQKPVQKQNIGESIKHFRSPRLAPVLLRQTAIKEKSPQVSNLPQKIPN